jgi:phosphoribosyl 1,2-cyclic phosphodiesterase
VKVRFYGVRGSLPTPSPETVRYGGNTSCIEIIVPESNEIFIFDAGTGIRPLGQKLARLQDKTINLFISHTHWDHIQGFPFFMPIYMPHHKVNVFGPTHDSVNLSLHDVLTRQMDYSVFPVRYGELQAKLTYNAMSREERVFGEVKVEAMPLNHPVLTLGYRLTHRGKSVVYQSDHEPFHDLFMDGSEDGGAFVEQLNGGVMEFARGADILIADSMYTAEEYTTHRGWGHSSIEDVIDRAVKAEVKRLAIFHHDPSHTDDFMDRIETHAREKVAERGSPIEIMVAREGMEIEL